jgi:hypothetical protein
MRDRTSRDVRECLPLNQFNEGKRRRPKQFCDGLRTQPSAGRLQSRGIGRKLMLLTLALLSTAAAATAATSLEDRVPLDLRGVPLGQALEELSHRTGVAYLVDALVEPADLATAVRITARHLNGAQAFRWLARSGGLEAVWTEGLFYIGRPERMPNGSEPDLQDIQEAQAAGMIQERRMDVAWEDIPLARVADDISSAFGIDVVFDAQILEVAPLIRLEQPVADLAFVVAALTNQLQAQAHVLDGAIWIHPQAMSASPPPTVPAATAAAQTSPVPPAEPVSQVMRPPPAVMADNDLEGRVVVTSSLKTWSEFADRLTAVAGFSCRIQPTEGVPAPAFQAAGSLREILEAGRLLGLWDWRIRSEGQDDRPFLEILPSLRP